MRKYFSNVSSVFLLKVFALILLAIFFSYYKEWYPNPPTDREAVYAPLSPLLQEQTPLGHPQKIPV